MCVYSEQNLIGQGEQIRSERAVWPVYIPTKGLASLMAHNNEI